VLTRKQCMSFARSRGNHFRSETKICQLSSDFLAINRVHNDYNVRPIISQNRRRHNFKTSLCYVVGTHVRVDIYDIFDRPRNVQGRQKGNPLRARTPDYCLKAFLAIALEALSPFSDSAGHPGCKVLDHCLQSFKIVLSPRRRRRSVADAGL